VFNLEKKISENVLQHLKFFTDFGRVAFEDAQRKEKTGNELAENPFQKLQVDLYTTGLG
jgi:hypothetical protein